MGENELKSQDKAKELFDGEKFRECADMCRELLKDTKNTDEDLFYTANLWLFRSLQQADAGFFDGDGQAEIMCAGMSAYNYRHDAAIMNYLREKFYLPYERQTKEIYENNLNIAKNLPFIEFSTSFSFPNYEHLPIQLFRNDENFSALYDPNEDKFIFRCESNDDFRLYHLMLSEKDLARFKDDFRANYPICEKRHISRWLLKKLRAKSEAKEFDDEYTALLEKLHNDEAKKAEYCFLSLDYYLDREDYAKALEFAEKAYIERPGVQELWPILRDLYHRAGNYEKAMFFLSCMILSGKAAFDSIPPQYYEFAPQLLIADSIKSYDQMIRSNLVVSGKNIVFDAGKEHRLGYYLQYDYKKRTPYWVGLYYENRLYLNGEAMQYDALSSNKNFYQGYSSLCFDLIRAKVARKITVPVKDGEEYAVSVAATDFQQKIIFRDENSDQPQEHEILFGKYAYQTFKLNSTTTISSNTDFACGLPVLLKHGSKRKRLVLNIFVDAMMWSLQKQRKFRDIPNMMKFFGEGVIFDNHFSVAEYTFSSFHAIQSGMYMHNNGVIHDSIVSKYRECVVPISERMSELGYNCIALQSDLHTYSHGALSGFNRIICSGFSSALREGVIRVIDFIDAFSETDNYLLLYCMDVHPYTQNNSIGIDAQMKLPYEVRSDNKDVPSVFLHNNLYNQVVVDVRMKKLDLYLGWLFDYIQNNYGENDYIVHLCSDHGLAIYSKYPWLMSDDQTNAALMARGAGVPRLGRVDEMVSGVDIYKIVGHNCGFPIDDEHLDGNLPAAFGGKERKYTYSNSIYPGQTYKLCIRSREHEFRLESKEFTRKDGTVDLTSYKYKLYGRNAEHKEIYNDALNRKFLRLAYDFTKTFADW